MIEWILAGNFLGIVTGLIPGLHVNTLAAILILIAEYDNMNWVLLVVGMAIMHSFVSFIPSTILGVGNSDNYSSALEGQKMFMDGDGITAIHYSIWGGVIAGIIGGMVIPIYWIGIKSIHYLLPTLIPPILLSLALILPLSEKNWTERGKAVFIIALAGVLGVFCLRQYPLENNLFVLISGLFGGSGLIQNLLHPVQASKQKTEVASVSLSSIIHGGILAGGAGIFTSLLPGIGPSEAAGIIGKLKEMKSKTFLTMVGGMDTANAMYGFLALYILGKTRSGSAAAVNELIHLTFNQVLMILLTVLISIGIAGILTPLLAKHVLASIQKIPYSKLNGSVLVFLLLLSLAFSGFIGAMVFLTGSMIGLSAIQLKVKRSYGMFAIIIPVLFFYFSG